MLLWSVPWDVSCDIEKAINFNGKMSCLQQKKLSMLIITMVRNLTQDSNEKASSNKRNWIKKHKFQWKGS